MRGKVAVGVVRVPEYQSYLQPPPKKFVYIICIGSSYHAHIPTQTIHSSIHSFNPNPNPSTQQSLLKKKKVTAVTYIRTTCPPTYRQDSLAFAFPSTNATQRGWIDRWMDVLHPIPSHLFPSSPFSQPTHSPREEHPQNPPKTPSHMPKCSYPFPFPYPYSESIPFHTPHPNPPHSMPFKQKNGKSEKEVLGSIRFPNRICQLS